MLLIDENDLIEARRLNKKLASAPRFSVRSCIAPILMQSLLRLSQFGGHRVVRRSGVSVEDRIVEAAGQKVGVRLLRPTGRVRGVILDIHGGGWVIGNARMNDALNIALIQACDVAVVSVD